MSSTVSIATDVCIVGGGISGLTLGFLLQQGSRDVVVLEKASEGGGVMRSYREDGFLFDTGPNSTMLKSGHLLELVEALGLEDHLCYASESSSRRYVLKSGRLIPLPASPASFIASPIMTFGEKLRVGKEIFVPKGPPGYEETVADFVRRRLGPAFLDTIINAFVAGVYASDPERLNVRAAFPKLYQLEQDYGGLFKGLIKKKRAQKNGEVGPMPRSKLISFDDGMQVLAHALERGLNGALCTGAEVNSVVRCGDGYTVHAVKDGMAREISANRLVLAGPAREMARLIEPHHASTAKSLAAIPYAPVVVVHHGFRREQVGHPLDGFGFLIPSRERRQILGTLWNTTLFPGRAPDGHVLLTTFVGGLRQPELTRGSDGDLLSLVQEELADLLDISGDPVVGRLQRWPRAIPQYVSGHQGVVESLQRLEKNLPGLHFAGSFRGGVSVSDRIERAALLADQILA